MTTDLETCSYCTEEVPDDILEEGPDGARLCPQCMPETMHCPLDGLQLVTGDAGATRGSDPYSITRLACGHKVIGLGPDPEDMVIV